MARARAPPPHQPGVGVRDHFDLQVDVFFTMSTQKPRVGVAPKSQSRPTVNPRSLR
jgi:hypothetical protein